MSTITGVTVDKKTIENIVDAAISNCIGSGNHKRPARKLINILSSELTGSASYLAASSMLEDEMHSCHNSFSVTTEIYKALGLEERIPAKHLNA
jgi:hypothetical protein